MDTNEIGKLIETKSALNSLVSENTHAAFSLFKQKANELNSFMNKNYPEVHCNFMNKGDFEFELSFGSDTLVFLLHTNVFEFSRMHEVMKLPYVKEDEKRSYCGVINIYNFLSDSFDYHRDMDMGYLIGRIFINNENHYFIEGKREVGLLYTSFHKAVINEESVENILLSSMEYATNFDLLVPPFDEVKIATVAEIDSQSTAKKQITAKRLGFKFEQDRN